MLESQQLRANCSVEYGYREGTHTTPDKQVIGFV